MSIRASRGKSGSNGRPDPGPNGHGLGVVIGPEPPSASDITHAATCRRLAEGRRVSRPALREALASDLFGPLARSILETNPGMRAQWPSTWIGYQKGRDRAAADTIERAMAEALPIVSVEPDDIAADEDEEAQPYRLNVLGAREFARTEYRMNWLVKRILVEGQPAVIAASKKGMKTTIAADLIVSAAMGASFLGVFDVAEPMPVLFLSGESGGFVIQDTIRRVCRAKQIDDFGERMEGRFFVGFDLPQLSVPEQLAELGRVIKENGIRLVVIDPLYLCLVGASSSTGRRIEPSNLFDMGPLFLSIAQACLKAGATPVLIHHFKQTGVTVGEMPELENMAYAGIQEFARQWILMSRRERFEPGSGVHKLWMCVGGSAGHSGEWGIDINEGQMADDFTGREWDVTVKPASEVRDEGAEKSKEMATARTRANDAAKDVQLNEDAIKALCKLEKLADKQATERALRDALNWNPRRVAATLHRLEEIGRIRSFTGPRKGKKGPLEVVYWAPVPGVDDDA